MPRAQTLVTMVTKLKREKTASEFFLLKLVQSQVLCINVTYVINVEFMKNNFKKIN